MNTVSSAVTNRTIQQSGIVDEASARREANLAAFRKMMEEAVQKANAQAHEEYLSQLTNPASTNVKLTDEQKKYLSETYNTQNMSQKDFEAFVEDLHKFGILSDKDKSILGYGDDDLRCFRTVCSVAPHVPGRNYNTLSDCDGNVLAWTKYQSSVEHFDPQAKKFYHSSASVLFARLHSVLQQIGFRGSPKVSRAVRDTVEIHREE